MQKLRFALLLPVIQAVVALGLIEWGEQTPGPRGADSFVPTAWLVCRGLNAPALLFRSLWAPTLDSPLRLIVGLDTSDFLFLLGVIVVWYFVGRALDQRSTLTPVGGRAVASAVTVHLLLLALGGLLLFVALHDFEYQVTSLAPVGAFLILLWSVSLLFLSGRGLLKAVRQTLVLTRR